MKHRLPIVAALLGALAATGSSAQASSSFIRTEIAPVRIELIDLDPNDGITPWIDFTSHAFAASALGNDPELSDAITAAGQASVTGNSGSAAGSTGMDALHAQVDVTRAGDGRQKYTASARRTTFFVLSPSTGLRISADTFIDAGADPGHENFAYAFVFNVFTEASGKHIAQAVDDHWYVWDGAGARTLSAYMASGLQEQHGHFVVIADAQTVAVPEPSSYAMLLAGACLIGVARRRARR